MGLKIGRVGIDVALRNAGSVNWKGDVVQLEGHMIATSAADLEAIREQLLGYATNNDEPCVPVVFDVDPTINGFYTLADVPEVATARSSYTAGGFLFPYRVSLRRVPRFSSPFFESSVLIALKTNPHGVTLGTPMIGLPGGYYNLVQQVANNLIRPNAPGNTRISEDGNLDFAGKYSVDSTTTTNMVGRNLIRYGVSPASYHLGGCKLNFGASLRAVTGPQTAIGSTAWSMSNGVVKVSSVAGSGDLDIGLWGGGSYRTKRYRILTSGISSVYTALPSPLSVQVVKVATHAVTIRLYYALVNQQYASGNEYLDLTLRRGSPTLEGAFTRTDNHWYSSTPGVRVAMATSEAATSQTGYIIATSADGAQLKYMILTSSTIIASDLVAGSLTFSSATNPTVVFGLSAVVDPSTVGANAPYRAVDIAGAFFAETSETIQVVA